MREENITAICQEIVEESRALAAEARRTIREARSAIEASRKVLEMTRESTAVATQFLNEATMDEP